MREIAQTLHKNARDAALRSPVRTLRRQGLKAAPCDISQCQETPKRSQTALSCHFSQWDTVSADGRPPRPTGNSSHADGCGACGYIAAFTRIVHHEAHFAEVQLEDTHGSTEGRAAMEWPSDGKRAVFVFLLLLGFPV